MADIFKALSKGLKKKVEEKMTIEDKETVELEALAKATEESNEAVNDQRSELKKVQDKEENKKTSESKGRTVGTAIDIRRLSGGSRYDATIITYDVDTKAIISVEEKTIGDNKMLALIKITDIFKDKILAGIDFRKKL